MANTILPEAKYKVVGVGPSKTVSFNGNDGNPVTMNNTAVQLEGHADMWVEVLTPSDKPKPVVGDELEGHVEQDDAGKWPPKFKKARKAGSWGGGGVQASPGAIWATRVQTATDAVTWYYDSTGKKPKDFAEVMARIKATAIDLNKMVEELVKVEELTKPAAAPAAGAAPAPNVDAGETAPPAETVKIDDIGEEELGKW